MFPGLPGMLGVPSIGGLGSVPALLYWIGGLLVFGIGGALQISDYDFKRPVDTIQLEE